MCSIFGFNAQGFKSAIPSFLDCMRHRGPDSESYIEVDNWILGHQRLSIIDTSSSANQPMTVDGNTIIFNGEIYNYQELKELYLKDVIMQTDSDTEVLLRCLNMYGTSILNQLNGMFAFAWYDSKKKELFLCRDRFGVKPLYWSKNDGAIIFSSEITPLAKLLKKCSRNERILDAFVVDTASDFDDETFISEIFQLRPGNIMRINSDGDQLMHIWYKGRDFQINPDFFSSESNLLNAYEDLLIDSIKLRLRSDVPTCITLSGGLDSSLIYAMAKEELGSNIKAFHFMHPGALTDETEKVLKIANKYNDIVCLLNPQLSVDPCKEISKALDFLEFPIWSPSALAYMQTYQEIKASGFSVVLEGHGSDEQLGGYSYMIDAAIDDYFARYRWCLAAEAAVCMYETSSPALGQRRAKIAAIISFFRRLGKSILFKVEPRFRAVMNEAFNYKILPIVLRAFDRLTMASSVESRAPFMDYRLVELGRCLPLNQLVSSMGNKTILRKLLKKRELSFIYEDKVKTGFSSDLPHFFSNYLVVNFFKAQIESLKFPQKYREIQRIALLKLDSKNIQWSDVDPIWKAFSLAWVFRKMDKVAFIK